MDGTSLSKKERREMRRHEKQSAQVSGARSKIIKKIAGWVLAIIIAAALGYVGYVYLFKDSAISEIGQSYTIEGREHVADGAKSEYHTNPPSSGPHYGSPAEWGVYDKPLQDEQVVHNLEHGGVWISYKPTISDTAKDKLKTIAKSYRSKVILTPREANDKDIALVSWGRAYKFNLNPDGTFDESSVNNFIKKYKNTGPEVVPD